MPTDAEKRQRHAESQRQYRERNLEATRAKARERMARLRAKPRTAEQTQEAAEKRRDADADYNEFRRRLKFVAKFGHQAFMEYYFPQYAILGKKHLPGLRFVWSDEEEAKRKRQRK